MIVDSDPICKFLETSGTTSEPIYLYECPCGTANEVTGDQHPFDLLHCWRCAKYSSRRGDLDVFDMIISQFGSNQHLVATGRPRKQIRAILRRLKRKP